MNNLRKFLASIVALAALSLMAIAPVAAQGVAVANTDVDFAQLYEDVSDSVVSIAVESTVESGDGDLPPGFSVPPGGQQVRSGGSGFVIDNEGHIVTNFHVVNSADRIEVAFRDGTLVEGRIVGTDPDSDLAVIRVDVAQDKLQPVQFGDSEALTVGEAVIAIGSPFGQNWTLTSGIISGLERSIQGLDDFSIGGVIQTDAAINPGNSGGPLLNTNGQVIGVNAQISSATRSNAGVGFAIPSNLTQRVARELIDQGFIQYSYLGIAGGDVPLRYLQAYDLPNDLRGVLVSDVVDGGPAARAGLQDAAGEMQAGGVAIAEQFDIITAIDGVPMTGVNRLITYISQNTRPGDTVTLDILRNGSEELRFDVRLAPRP